MPDTPDLRLFPMKKGPPIPWFMAEAIYKNIYRGMDPRTLEHYAEYGGFSWTEVLAIWQEPAWRSPVKNRSECSNDIANALKALS